MDKYVFINIVIYIYIDRESEREKDTDRCLNLNHLYNRSIHLKLAKGVLLGSPIDASISRGNSRMEIAWKSGLPKLEAFR